MRAKILIAFLIAFAIFACNKDKFTSKPQLKLDSVNGSVYPKGSQIEFVLKGTDKEGNIKDTLWVQRISLICPDFITDKPAAYTLPDFIKKNDLDVEFVVKYNYGVSIPPFTDGCVSKDDSSYFRFWIKDNDENTSDTVQSPVLVLLN